MLKHQIKILKFIPNGIFYDWNVDDENYSKEPEVSRIMDKNNLYHVYFFFEDLSLTKMGHSVLYAGHIQTYSYHNICRLKVGDMMTLDDLTDFESEFEGICKCPWFCFWDIYERDNTLFKQYISDDDDDNE